MSIFTQVKDLSKIKLGKGIILARVCQIKSTTSDIVLIAKDKKESAPSVVYAEVVAAHESVMDFSPGDILLSWRTILDGYTMDGEDYIQLSEFSVVAAVSADNFNKEK